MQKKFPLLAVLKYRNTKLDIEKGRLARLTSIREQAQQNLDSTNQIIQEKRKELEEDISQGSFLETDMYDKFIKLSIIMGARHEQELASASRAVDQQKRNVNIALQNLQIIEKLEEKHKEEYRVYINKLEQKELDELSILRSRYNEN